MRPLRRLKIALALKAPHASESIKRFFIEETPDIRTHDSAYQVLNLEGQINQCCRVFPSAGARRGCRRVAACNARTERTSVYSHVPKLNRIANHFITPLSQLVAVSLLSSIIQELRNSEIPPLKSIVHSTVAKIIPPASISVILPARWNRLIASCGVFREEVWVGK